MKELKIGIIVADIDEYKPFAKLIENGEFKKYSVLGRIGHEFIVKNQNKCARVITLLCGIGKVNAAAAAMHLVDIGCNIILNYGLSGGISGVNRGDICLCDKFIEHDFDLSGIGYALCEKPLQKYIYTADKNLIEVAKRVIGTAKVGTAVSGDHFICDVAKRDSLKENFSAMSCDMETAAIAYVCEFSNTPFLALRRISDDAGADATEAYRNMNSSDETLLSDYLIQIIKEIM